jgi:diketogulonate reductase-like aldo/keto reductase
MKLSEKYDATPARIALSWLIQQDNILTIPKTSNYQHLIENARAMDIQIEPDDFIRLSQSFKDE